ncbi:MAG TPA: hypothetical protein VF546_09035 [Pyrinomonadaceae bacterium]|jgi:hypothetical protein
MTREEALAYKTRWRLVNEAHAAEIRRTPVALKLQQLALMYEAAHALGWQAQLRAGEAEVRERWRRLKEKLYA